MNDEQLLRYSRHILLDGIGIEGQQRLLASRVLLVGAGGLGCTAGMFLGAAGVGHITVVDDDVVEATNLQRQIAHSLERLGTPKASSLKQSIAALNPDPQVSALQQRATLSQLQTWVAQADLVLDCTDNYATRHNINRACVKARKPLVSGAATGWDGQLALFNPAAPDDAPCYACLFDPAQPSPDTNCATMGVVAPLVGMVGSMQAQMALRVLCGLSVDAHQLLLIDGRSLTQQAIRMTRNPACPVCSTQDKG
jgi:molybdopterin/thiamine biosynthesis adenylyltransferase